MLRNRSGLSSARRPHYTAASEQQKIEFAAGRYLRNIVTELGLRYKKELLPMKKEQVYLENGIVHIADSTNNDQRSATCFWPMPRATRSAVR